VRRLNGVLRSRRGESLVELLAASVVFLLLLAAFHGAVRFSSNALRKSGDIRENAAALQVSLRGAAADGGTLADYTFQAVSPDGSVTGGTVLFRVPVLLQTKTAHGKDGESVVFYVFGAPSEGGPP